MQTNNRPDRMDVSHLGKSDAGFIKALINNYQPQKPTNVPVQMKLVLANEKSIYQRPRWVSYEDHRYIGERNSSR